MDLLLKESNLLTEISRLMFLSKAFNGKAIINLGASQINGQFLLRTGYHLFITRILTRRIGT